MAYHRAAPGDLPAPPRSRRELWLACWQGRLPAEVLPTKDREDLVWQLVTAGWSDLQIAQHTCMTVYTTARIRDHLGLGPNDIHEEAA
jgi:hypothetical protein